MSTEAPRRHHQPRVELRVAQAYVAITGRASTEAGFRAAVDRDMPAVFRWVQARGLTPSGPPFIRYLVVDETRRPEEGPPPATFESGVPLSVVPADLGARPAGTVGTDFHAGELPAGTWLVALHRGGYSGLARAHELVHAWAAEERVRVDRRPAADGTAFGGAVEHFRVGPFQERDPWRWETDVAYLVVDDGR